MNNIVRQLFIGVMFLVLVPEVGSQELKNTKKIAFERCGYIFVADPDGKNEKRLTDSGCDFRPVFSPDGTKIAFQSRRDKNFEIYVMDCDGKNQIRLTKNDAADVSPSWSPDGKGISFASDREKNKNGRNFDVFITTPDESGSWDSEHKIEWNVTQMSSWWDASPSWLVSQDGKGEPKIVFESNRSGKFEIYIVQANGRNLIQLTEGATYNSSPSCSPDGKKIAFVSEEDGNFGICLLEIDQAKLGKDKYNPKRLTSGSIDRNPAWSWDSKSILFVRVEKDKKNIYVLDIDDPNKKPRLLITNGDTPSCQAK